MGLCDRITFRLSNFQFWISLYVSVFFLSINRVMTTYVKKVCSKMAWRLSGFVNLVTFFLLILVAFHWHYQDTCNAVPLQNEKSGDWRWFVNPAQPTEHIKDHNYAKFVLTFKGIWHPFAHVRQFDFLSDGTVFKVDICDKNPYPSTLRGVWK